VSTWAATGGMRRGDGQREQCASGRTGNVAPLFGAATLAATRPTPLRSGRHDFWMRPVSRGSKSHFLFQREARTTRDGWAGGTSACSPAVPRQCSSARGRTGKRAECCRRHIGWLSLCPLPPQPGQRPERWNRGSPGSHLRPARRPRRPPRGAPVRPRHGHECVRRGGSHSGRPSRSQHVALPAHGARRALCSRSRFTR